MESQTKRRREARRRCILEHAENRIKRIMGEVEKIDDKPAISEEAIVLKDISEKVKHEHEFSSSYRRRNSLGEKIVGDTDFNLTPHENINYKNNKICLNITITAFFFSIRLHVILLGIFVCMFFTNTSAFLPFVVLESISLIFMLIECEKKSMGLFGALLLASGLSAEKIAFVFRYMQALSMLRDDIAIYLFTVVIFRALLENSGVSGYSLTL